jgi:hypothetical protein
MADSVAEQYALFQRYAPFIAVLPERERYDKEDLFIPDLLLHHEGRLEIYYAPFDYVNEKARVVLLGITPGWMQMEIAHREARRALLTGLSTTEVCRHAKTRASFAGSMRGNLVSMLDGLGLPRLLGVPSGESLFGEHRPLIHTTSAIRYPVFVNGRNYTGHGPGILDVPLLRHFVEHRLAGELRRTPGAVVIPLGKSVSTVLEHLCARGVVERSRCLLGFPHPSGANGHRLRDFAEHREGLARQMESRLR